ncbi:hypothetical protein SAMN06297251_12652 [Fulvimarina manganoxydans]|uniref:Uncharacterized protein n=1 Tax=Fulvimarina manganoxydans TaxID=937218 RepID=A0A1W2EJK8_9HYPH|nr:hypothetical protein [Fulvimarina manganoxydans]SMD09672.1 hypothetical protein SAMN06297251_12652 [Fulvimarina manganoxydans]
MRTDLTSRQTGTPILDWIEQIHTNIEDYDVTLGLITAAGISDFGLSGDDLVEFARRCLEKLMAVGAIPVLHEGNDYCPFVPTLRYGRKPEDIVENILASWQAGGGGVTGWGEYSFTMPENILPEWLERWEQGLPVDPEVH